METELIQVNVSPKLPEQLVTVVGSAIAAFVAGKFAEKGIHAAFAAFRNRAA